MGYSADLRRELASTWEAQHQHPFVQGIGDGTLDPEKFQFWLRQDYLFLIEYCRLLGVAAARSPDLPTLTRFAELLSATAGTEMSMHREYAAEFGIEQKELELSEMAPTTRAYTDFLLRSATVGDFRELVAALLPCMWGFAEVGTRLAARVSPNGSRYATWIAGYSSSEFVDLAGWCRTVFDAQAEGAKPGELERMREAFLVSSRYELAFWEMAWRQEAWGT